MVDATAVPVPAIWISLRRRVFNEISLERTWGLAKGGSLTVRKMSTNSRRFSVSFGLAVPRSSSYWKIRAVLRLLLFGTNDREVKRCRRSGGIERCEQELTTGGRGSRCGY